MSRAVRCDRCGQEWPRDPVLEVECPVCGAQPGQACRAARPSGYVHSASFAGLPPWGHDERDILAMQIVPGYGRCPASRGSAPDLAPAVAQADLFAFGAMGMEEEGKAR